MAFSSSFCFLPVKRARRQFSQITDTEYSLELQDKHSIYINIQSRIIRIDHSLHSGKLLDFLGPPHVNPTYERILPALGKIMVDALALQELLKLVGYPLIALVRYLILYASSTE